jgi:hypothetical protein
MLNRCDPRQLLSPRVMGTLRCALAERVAESARLRQAEGAFPISLVAMRD